FFDDGIVFDHFKKQTQYYYNEKNRIQKIEPLLDEKPIDMRVEFGKPESNLDQKEFSERVKRAKGYIRSGDIFQVVISKRYKIPFRGSLLPFYNQLRRINPSPYMYYLKFGGREIVGSSPEMLARKTGRSAESYPSARTRPSTGDSARTHALRAELLPDEHERAEHVSLVDPARNAIRRRCEHGTGA